MNLVSIPCVFAGQGHVVGEKVGAPLGVGEGGRHHDEGHIIRDQSRHTLITDDVIVNEGFSQNWIRLEHVLQANLAIV